METAKHPATNPDTLASFLGVLEAVGATLSLGCVCVLDDMLVWQVTVAYASQDPNADPKGVAHKVQGAGLAECFENLRLHFSQLVQKLEARAAESPTPAQILED